MNQEITIWFIIDENMSKIMKKHCFLRKSKMAELKNGEFGVLLKWFLRGLQASPWNHQVYLLTKMEFDGKKVPKTYENEFWNRHNAKDWWIFTVFLVTAKPYKNQYKKAKPRGCISHQSNNYIIILTLLMGRSHRQLSNGGVMISRRRL